VWHRDYLEPKLQSLCSNIFESAKLISSKKIYPYNSCVSHNSRFFTQLSSLYLLPFDSPSCSAILLQLKINEPKSMVFVTQSTIYKVTHESIRYWKEAKQNYNNDITNSKMSSYEIWTMRRFKIKQKQKVIKTLVWLLNNPNIREINWIGWNK
jgi:hypothetical protein